MKFFGIAVLATAGMLLLTLVISQASERTGTAGLARHLDSLPSQLGGWSVAGTGSRLDPQVEAKLGATEYMSRIYRRGTDASELFIAYYANQRAGESMHSPLNCLPGSGWEFWNRAAARVPFAGGTVSVNQDGIQKEGAREVVVYWYQTPSRVFADEYVGKVYLIWDSITKGQTSGAIVRLVVANQPDSVQAALNLAPLVMSEVQKSFHR